jgi:4-hydroxymandelate oxidase
MFAGGAALFAAASPAADPVLLSRIASVNEFESLAKARLTSVTYDFLAGGAGSEVTLRANVEAWERVRIRPRVFVDVSRIDTRVKLLGSELPHPILLAPTAYHRLFHAAGEIETVKGASLSGSILVASSFATTLIEDMARASPAKLWFQLYVQLDRGFTRALVQRAEAAGCAALCLTADFAVRGYRDRDIRNAFTLPAGLDRANLRGLGATASTNVLPSDGIYNAAQDPSFRWRDLSAPTAASRY